MASTASVKRRRSSSSTGDIVIVKRSQGLMQNIYGDTNVSGSANVHLGDNLYFGDKDNALKQEAQRLKDSLFFQGMHERYERLREAADQTYQWILDPGPEPEKATDRKRKHAASFLNWFRHGRGIFWLSGKPGSGKSTLMKYLAEHIASKDSEVDQPRLIVLSFFFWIKGDDLQRSKTGCMRSLLWQLLQNPSTMNLAMQTCDLYFKGAWTESVLRTILSTTLRDTEHSITIFIDGLDESNDHDEVLASLSIFESATRTKTCVSSRPEAIFVDTLKSCQSLRLQDLNSADIQKVVKNSFLENTRVLALAAKLTTEEAKKDLEELGRTIEWKSQGVFLWVHLVIKDLLRGITQRDDLSTLSQRLNRLPNDIYALYKDMFQRVHHDHDLYKDKTALYLALALHRDFSVVEFCLAVDENLRQKYLCSSIFKVKADVDTGAKIDCETVMLQVHVFTAGLLEVQNYNPSYYLREPSGGYPLASRYPSLSHELKSFGRLSVQFIHRTAIDFLRQTAEGISLMTMSSRVEGQIKQLCFESNLIRHVVLPGILSLCVSEDNMVGFLMGCYSCDDEDMYNALKQQGLSVLNSFHSAGLLFADRSSWELSNRKPHACSPSDRITDFFPSSGVDLATVLIKARRYRAAERWLADCEYMNDKQYLTKIIITLLSTRNIHLDDQELEKLETQLKGLHESDALHDPHQNPTT